MNEHETTRQIVKRDSGRETGDPPDKRRCPAAGTARHKSWRDVLPVHPAADLFPMMSRDELIALGEDIKKNGLLAGPVLWESEKGAPLQLLDGRNRLDAMEAVGLPILDPEGEWLIVDVDWKSSRIRRQDPYALALSINIHRRHLTAEQKRDLIAKVLKATPDKSNRQIAETVKVDHKTVAAVRAEKQATGEIPQLEATTGKDGKARKQPTKRSAPAAVVTFTPKAMQDDGDVPVVDDEDDAVDLTDARNRAHAICGALSTIDLVDIDPQEFWAVFGSESLKVSTMKWVTTALEKLIGIAEIGAAKVQIATPNGEEIRPTNADEVATLANGLRAYLAGLDPITDRIIEIGDRDFWSLLGPTACSGLAETMDGLWRLQGIARGYKKLRLPS